MDKKENNCKQILDKQFFRILFIVSTTVMTGLLSIRGSVKIILIGVIISFIIISFITYKYNFINLVFKEFNKAYIILSVVFTIFSDSYFVIYFYKQLMRAFEKFGNPFSIPNDSMVFKLLTCMIGVVASFAIFIFWHYICRRLIPYLGMFVRGLNKVERNYLAISTLILSICIILIFNKTNVFYEPSVNGKVIEYDVVYTSDTGNLVTSNAYVNINADQNDIRQPLFGVFALPFGVAAAIVSKILFFIPNSYPIILNIIQIFLLNIAILLISRMLKLNSELRVIFFIFMSVSYPYLLFTLNMEQYVLVVFWMILFIYSYVENKKGRVVLFIGATGSLLTTGVLFPIISMERKLIQWIKDILCTGLIFFSIITVCGQLPILIGSIQSIRSLMVWSGTYLSYNEKLLQYVNFVSSCFIKPDSIIKFDSFNNITYQLAEVTKLNVFGLLILIVAILGFILNYKNRFAQICFFWSVYSFILLCKVGWGTTENGLVLYALYFSWAFISLVFLMLYKLFIKFPKINNLLLIIVVFYMIGVNSKGILELIEFGIKNYPYLIGG